MKVLSRHSGAGWPGARPLPRKSRSTLSRPKLRQSFPKSDSPPVSFATPRHAARSDLVARTHGLLFLLIPVVEPVCTRRVGGDGGSSFLPVRNGIAWCAHVAHRARTIDCGLARRSRHRRGDAQSRRSALGRSALGRASRIPASALLQPTASASCGSLPITLAPRFIRQVRGCRPSCPRRESGSRGCCRPW